MYIIKFPLPMKVIITHLLLFILLVSSYSLEAQLVIPEIEIQVSKNNDFVCIHNIKKGETLYSLAKFYKVPLDRLMAVNQIKENQIVSLGSQIKIPLERNLIIKSPGKTNLEWIPVIYTVKKQETLYTIAKKYFSQSIDDLNARNNINSFTIQEDQKLVVGWWDNTVHLPAATTPLIPELAPTERERNPIIASIPLLKHPGTPRLQRIYNTYDNIYMPIDTAGLVTQKDSVVIDNRNHISKKAICLWMKDDPETKQLLAFHKSAKIGSTINVSYPLTKRSVEVLVIDNIKPNLYPDDIEIIITKAVALQLGARDSRIQINMDYYQ